ncbi:hypothetical protein [Stenotrophomonas lactitubi]|uniref:hypothetical protein n=1 Tax=Stenotrophomonas lactitubi TaxID=2045214 RepID=UPI00203D6B37|nr:hypothetical protein [Stenotrophomonas lactitubi]
MMIDFSKLGMPVFTGRQRGQDARKKLGLDSIDENEDCKVLIPDEVYAITSSYFLGLFGPSVRKFGGKDAFFSHFHFEGPRHITDKLDDFATRALRDGSGLF